MTDGGLGGGGGGGDRESDKNVCLCLCTFENEGCFADNTRSLLNSLSDFTHFARSKLHTKIYTPLQARVYFARILA